MIVLQYCFYFYHTSAWISHRCTYVPEKAMAPHSSTLAWTTPWMEEPGGLQSLGLWRVRRDWATSLSLFTFMHWRRKWQPTPVFLPGESQGWGCTELDTNEVALAAAAIAARMSAPAWNCLPLPTFPHPSRLLQSRGVRSLPAWLSSDPFHGGSSMESGSQKRGSTYGGWEPEWWI